MSFDSDPNPELWDHPLAAFCAFDAWLRPMLGNVYSDRKCVLFGVACCRLVEDHWADPRVRAAVDAAERFADSAHARERRSSSWYLEGEAAAFPTDAESATAYAQWLAARAALAPDGPRPESPSVRLARAVVNFPHWQLGSDCYQAAHELRGGTWTADGHPDCSAFGPVLREVFLNPFRRPQLSLRWRTETVVLMARLMYQSRDFTAMPILADALQDAGCDNEDILSHCRSDGPHVRGCWVVDLVLGKE